MALSQTVWKTIQATLWQSSNRDPFDLFHQLTVYSELKFVYHAEDSLLNMYRTFTSFVVIHESVSGIARTVISTFKIGTLVLAATLPWQRTFVDIYGRYRERVLDDSR